MQLYKCMKSKQYRKPSREKFRKIHILYSISTDANALPHAAAESTSFTRWPAHLENDTVTMQVKRKYKGASAISFADIRALRKGECDMSYKKTAVFGIYGSRSAAENAIDVLTESGFPITDVSVLVPESLGSNEMRTEKATKAPEGAAAGAGSGAVLGGTLGLLAGIGALAIPGVGPLIAAGPILSALAGIGVGGAVGGVAGGLIGMGIPEYEAKRYEGRLQKGGILVSVHCDTSEEVKQAKEIMKRTGGEDISSTGESSTESTRTGRDMHRTAFQ
jgi:hypothetical protein